MGGGGFAVHRYGIPAGTMLALFFLFMGSCGSGLLSVKRSLSRVALQFGHGRSRAMYCKL